LLRSFVVNSVLSVTSTVLQSVILAV